MNELIDYIKTLPAGTKVTAAQMCAQVQGAKLDRKLLAVVRALRVAGYIKLVGIATYEVV